MIPADERERFDQCVRSAWSLARARQVRDGYAELDLGLTWAETPAIHPVTWEESPPDPWTEQLVALYRSAIVRFLAEFGPAAAAWTSGGAGGGAMDLLAPPLVEEVSPPVERARRLQQEARDLRTPSDEIQPETRELQQRFEQARAEWRRQRPT